MPDKWAIPPSAVVPENEFWIPIFKTGKHTPGNTGVEEEYKIDRIEELVANTNKYGQPILIKEGHWSDDGYPAGGVFHNQLKIEKNIVYAKVHYFTPAMAEAIKRGEFPSRSVEIGLDKDKEVIKAVAMLGSANPAVKDLGITPADFSSNTNKILIFSEVDLMDPEKKIKELEKELSELKASLEKEQANSQELSTQLDEANTKIEEFSTSQPKPEPEKDPKVEALEKKIEALEAREKQHNIEAMFSGIQIPGIDKTDLVEIAKNLDNTTVKTFSSGDKATTLQKLFNSLDAVSKTFAKLTEQNITPESLKEQEKVFFGDGDPELLDKSIKAYAAEHNLNYAKALDEMKNKQLIK